MTDENRVLRIGHRGAPSHFLENTIRSLQHAIDIGVDMVEFDIRKTLDDQFVLLHKGRLGRWFSRSSRISKRRLHEILNHGVGSEDPIALLQDAIDAVKGRALMNIDLKARGGEERLVDVIVQKGVENDVLISSHHSESLRKIKKIEPKIRTGISLPKDPFRLSGNRVNYFPPLQIPALWMMRKTLRFWIMRQIEKAEADTVMLYYKLITPGLVETLRSHGFPVFAWTVDDRAAIQRMRAMGVQGIASNHPELL